MKILIIGGTGLISTSITRELLERGDEVTLYNRGTTEARFPAGAKIINGDRNDFPAFENQMAEAGSFDVVIDMICFRPDQAESAIRAFKGRIGQFIFCSTVDVYNKPTFIHPTAESTEPRDANSDYGRNKVICEDTFVEAAQRGDFQVTTLRPAHTYSDVGTIIHSLGWSTSLLDRIRRGKPIIIHGDGTALWVSCHADDVGHAFVTACGNPVAYGKAYHLPGEEWRNWDQYHQGVAEAIGVPLPEIVHIPTEVLFKLRPQETDATYRNFQFSNIFDTTAARTDLDFKYTIRWVEGARRTYQWLDKNGRIKNADDEPYYDRIIELWRDAVKGMEAADL